MAFGLPCFSVTWETWEALPLPVHPMVSVQAALPRGAPLPLLVWELNFLVQLIVKSLTATQVPSAKALCILPPRVPCIWHRRWWISSKGRTPVVPWLPSIPLCWSLLADVSLVSEIT